MKYISFLSVVICAAVLGLASSVHAQNIDSAGIRAKAQQYANEVFKNCDEFAQEGFIEEYVGLLKRVEITTIQSYSAADYTLLSGILLRNKCNPDLIRDNEFNFNPDNFNPLKYNLNYYPDSDKVYRVDNTSYLIIIHPNL